MIFDIWEKILLQYILLDMSKQALIAYINMF